MLGLSRHIQLCKLGHEGAVGRDFAFQRTHVPVRQDFFLRSRLLSAIRWLGTALSRLLLRFVGLGPLVAARHCVHKLHDLADRLCIEGVLEAFHVRHLLKDLPEVFTLVDVEE